MPTNPNVAVDLKAAPARVYPVDPKTRLEVRSRFQTRAFNPEQLGRVAMLRANYETLAEMILTSTPPGRSQAIALSDLETSLHAAVKAITHEEE